MKMLILLMLVVLGSQTELAHGQIATCELKTVTETDWYGAGVHQYFSGKYIGSIRSLSIAIVRNQRDPRPHFFRGLAKLQLDLPEEAAIDFQKGAFWEIYRNGRASSSVNRALERVQGASRLQIESIRRAARINHAISSDVDFNISPVMYGEIIEIPYMTPWIQKSIPKSPKVSPPQPDFD